MADTLFLVQHWKKQQKIFLANLVLLRQKSGSTAIHDWRVAVKKLRSYLKLCFLILEKKYEKDLLNSTEKLFRTMGKQRDIEMSQGLLTATEKENTATYPSFRSHLDFAFSAAEKRMKDVLQNYDPGELQKALESIKAGFSQVSEETLKEQTIHIIKKQIKKISILLKDISKKNAHQLRKLMKDLLYWVSICPFPSPIDPGRLKKLNKILDRLGDWQDQEVFLLYSRHFRNDLLAKGSEEFDAHKQMEKKFKKRKQEYLQKTGTMANGFFSKVQA